MAQEFVDVKLAGFPSTLAKFAVATVNSQKNALWLVLKEHVKKHLESDVTGLGPYLPAHRNINQIFTPDAAAAARTSLCLHGGTPRHDRTARECQPRHRAR